MNTLPRDGCPAMAVLDAAARDEAVDSDVEQHLDHCAECQAVLANMRSNNDFLAHHRQDLAAQSAGPGMIPGCKLLGEIHRGGQGIVYKAIQTATQRTVAIKVLRAGTLTGREERSRFEREARILGQLQHPNIVTVHDSGIAEGLHYLVLDYVSGKTLDGHIAEGLPEIRATLGLLAKICEAVHAAHLHGIIHRDLKPSNVMIDASGEPHVLDFGLAKATGETADLTRTTLTGQFFGTPAWTSPEQAEGDMAKVDLRTDVYALGVLSYYLLTGAHPYDVSGSLHAILENVRHAPPASPRLCRQQIDGEIETIVLKCLQKDPERRYQTAGELALDIRRYLAGEVIAAKRDSTLYVLRKLALRHRIPVSIGGAALFAIIAALIGVSLLSRSLDAQRRRAEAALAESNVGRARLMVKTGDVLRAEQMLWREALDAGVVANDDMGFESTPTGRRAAWALLELYALVPKLMTVQMESTPARIDFDANGRVLRVVHEDGVVERWSLDGHRIARSPGFLPALRSALQFSRDGRRALITADYCILSVFDLDARVQLAGPYRWPDAVRCCALSDDGEIIALVDHCGAAYILDAGTTGILAVIDGPATHAVISGSYLFLTIDASPQPEVHTYSLDDGCAISTLRLPVKQSGSIPRASATVTPNGKYVLIVDESNLYVFDPVTGGDPIVSGSQTSPIGHAKFDATGRRAISTTRDGIMTIWGVPGLETLRVLKTMQKMQDVALADEIAATVTPDASVTVWNVGQTFWSERWPASARTTHGLAISPDGLTLATGDNLGRLTVQGLTDEGQAGASIEAHSDMITSIDFAPTGDRFVTGGIDGAVREWTALGTPMREIAADLGHIWCVRYSSDGYWIAASGGDGRVHLWSTRDTSAARILSGHRTRVPQVDFSPDGRMLVSLSKEGDAILWDVQSAAQMRTFGRRAFSSRAITFSPDGATIAIGADDRTICFWDTQTGELCRTMSGMPWGPFDIQYHPSGRVLFAVGSSGEIVVVDPETCTELATFAAHERQIMVLRLSGDGRQLITAGQDDWIGVWDLEHLRRCAVGNMEFHRGRTQQRNRVPKLSDL
ncbi:MAG: protein kinase domain-containing protein [Phycisphaerae bacterium]